MSLGFLVAQSFSSVPSRCHPAGGQGCSFVNCDLYPDFNIGFPSQLVEIFLISWAKALANHFGLEKGKLSILCRFPLRKDSLVTVTVGLR